MSWWTDTRDAVESAASVVTPFDFRGESARKKKTGFTGAANKARNYEEALFNKITGRTPEADKRNQARQVQEQVDAYKKLTAITEKEIETKRVEKADEKRKVNEKQIRQLRNRYRPSGGLLNYAGGGQPSSNQLSSNQGALTQNLGE
jgi:hypothetical protein